MVPVVFGDIPRLFDPLVLHIIAIDILAAGGLDAGPADFFRTDCEGRDKLLQILTLTGRAGRDGGLEHQQLELVPATAAFVIEDWHDLDKS